MQYIQGKTALITGISKGIGKSLAQQLLDAGAKVVGWGLTVPDWSHPNLTFISCDVSNESAVESAFAQTTALGFEIDFLINNAGFGYFAPLEQFDLQQFRRMFEVNVFGLFYVTKAVAPSMQKRQTGHIINVSSIAGKTGMAQGEGYNGTKFAVTGMSESLFHELRTANIKVTTVLPGSTATHFFDDIPNFQVHPMMMNPEEVALMMMHCLNTSPNFVIREIEMRPLRSK
jgi:short-subunit dehydrogenase